MSLLRRNTRKKARKRSLVVMRHTKKKSFLMRASYKNSKPSPFKVFLQKLKATDLRKNLRLDSAFPLLGKKKHNKANKIKASNHEGSSQNRKKISLLTKKNKRWGKDRKSKRRRKRKKKKRKTKPRVTSAKTTKTGTSAKNKSCTTGEYTRINKSYSKTNIKLKGNHVSSLKHLTNRF